MKRIIVWGLLLLAFFLPATRAEADFFPLAPSESVLGNLELYTVRKGESLIEIARKFDLGYNEIMDANPGIDPFVPGEGVTVNIPTFWVLPVVESSETILINLSELRLYYFLDQNGSKFVQTFPIGIGSEGNRTPVGAFKVIEKIIAPSWHVPESIRLENPELPRIVPPGPENPLGTHALRLSERSILIHGTNRPFAVGRMASHGCIRLYPEDIPILFALAPKGAQVSIVHQPIKVGIRNDRIYMEVHNDPSAEITFSDAVTLLSRKGLLGRTNIQKLRITLDKKDGIPADIAQ